MPFNHPSDVIQKQYRVEPLAHESIPEDSPAGVQVLWIGCSDSWTTETDTVDVHRDHLIVHRNLGSIVSNQDLSSASTIEHCVGTLQVRHIVICGHYDCCLLKAEDDPEAKHGLKGWYKDLSTLHAANESVLESSMSETEKDRHLIEVYILAEAEWLKKQPIVQKAMQERGLKVHAFVFDKGTNACARLVEV
ncbi:MAG: hypothetical protein M1818_007970 [Claussenomyces sp. TS43310]|nr:MAG: hypothetical protein M1818_007970 [Claussenomyces sp. TS43310]